MDADLALQAVGLRSQHSSVGENASDELSVMPDAYFAPPDFGQDPPLALRATPLAIAHPVRHRPRVGVVNGSEPRFAMLLDKQPDRLNRLTRLGRFRAAAELNPAR